MDYSVLCFRAEQSSKFIGKSAKQRAEILGHLYLNQDVFKRIISYAHIIFTLLILVYFYLKQDVF